MKYGVLDAYSGESLRVALYESGGNSMVLETKPVAEWQEILKSNDSISYDFGFDGNLLKASMGAKKLERLEPKRVELKFEDCLVDLLEWLVKYEASIEVREGDQAVEVEARKLNVSRSTMTVFISAYLEGYGWKSQKIVYVDKRDGLVQVPFRFRVDAKLPRKFEEYCEEKEGLWEYNGKMLIAPILENGEYYIACPAYFHERLVTAEKAKAVVMATSCIKNEVVTELVGEEKERPKYVSDVSKKAVVVKGPRVREEDFRAAVGLLRAKGEMYKTTPLKEYKDLINTTHAGFKLVIFNYLIDATTTVEGEVERVVKVLRDRVLYEMIQKIAELDVYRHRLYIYLNNIYFSYPHSNMPHENLLLFGGFDSSKFELERKM